MHRLKPLLPLLFGSIVGSIIPLIRASYPYLSGIMAATILTILLLIYLPKIAYPKNSARNAFFHVVRFVWRKGARRALIIRRCSDPRALRETLRRAIGDNVDSSGISPLACFKRWVKNKYVIFRSIEDVIILHQKQIPPVFGKVLGFYSVFPLKEGAYEQLLAGILHYDNINDSHILKSTQNPHDQSPDKIWMFVLDFEMLNSEFLNPNPSYLACDLIRLLYQWATKIQSVEGIATLAATDKGKRFAKSFGLVNSVPYPLNENLTWEILYVSKDKFLAMLSLISSEFGEFLSTFDPGESCIIENDAKKHFDQMAIGIRRALRPMSL